MDKEKKKSRHSKPKPVVREKKKRKVRDRFMFWKHRNRNDYGKLKSSVENISSSTDTIQSLSVKCGLVNDAFVLDTVKVAGNHLHTSMTFVAAAADSVSGSSSTSDEDECMSVVSCANSDETQTATPRHLDTPCIHCIHSQHEILELSNKVAQLSIEKEQQTLSAIYLHQECREMAKEKQLLIEQHKEEIQQITVTVGSTMKKLQEEFGKLNAEVSSLKEVNDSLMSKVLWTEEEKFMLKEERQELLTQYSDLKSENSKLLQNMTILMQKFGKVKRGLSQKNDKYNVSIANAEHVSFVN